jgi:predicted HicB family RNase H-like nuclease
MARTWPNISIRINPEALHRARVAAVTDKKTLGQWLEEAIAEKVRREKEADDVTQANR